MAFGAGAAKPSKGLASYDAFDSTVWDYPVKVPICGQTHNQPNGMRCTLDKGHGGTCLLSAPMGGEGRRGQAPTFMGQLPSGRNVPRVPPTEPTTGEPDVEPSIISTYLAGEGASEAAKAELRDAVESELGRPMGPDEWAELVRLDLAPADAPDPVG